MQSALLRVTSSFCEANTAKPRSTSLSNGLATRAQLTYGVSSPMLDYRLRVSGAHVIHQGGCG